MALRILLEIIKNNVRIVNHPTDNTLKRVIIDKGGAPSVRAIRVEDTTGSAPTNPVGNLHTGDAGAGNTAPASLVGYAIDLPLELAERLNRYIHFKDKIKQACGAFGDTFIDLRNLVYDGTIDGSNTNRFVGLCKADGRVDTVTATNNKILIIDQVNLNPTNLDTRAKWEAHFSFLNVDNGEDFDKTYKHASNPTDDFKLELDAFWETEELIKRLGDTYDGTKTFPTEATMKADIKELELYNYLGSLGTKGYEYNVNDEITLINGGKIKISAVLTLDRTNDDNKKKINELAKKALYETKISNDAASNVEFYESKIDFFNGFVTEAELWKSAAGLENFDEVLKANANGFRISERAMGSGHVTIGEGVMKDGSGAPGTNFGNVFFDANRAAIQKFFEDGKKKYRGFDIIENSQVVGKGDNSDSRVGTNVSANTWLCLFDKAAAPSATISKTNIDNFRKVFTNNTEITPKDCRGFGLGDIVLEGTDPKYKKSTGGGYRTEKLADKIKVKKNNGAGAEVETLPTKNYFDIDDAIETKSTGSSEEKADAAIAAFYKASFRETHSEEDLLDLYSHPVHKKADYSGTAAVKTKWDAALAEAKKLLELLKFDLVGKTDTDKNTAKTELTNYKDGANGKPKFEGLEKEIRDKIDYISGVSSLDQEIDTAINAEAGKAKEVFEKFKGLTDATVKTKEVFEELKKLVGLLKNADVKKSDLNPFKDDAAAASPGKQGKAWKVAEEVKDGGEGWATKIWNTAKEGNQQEIEDAKTELSSAIEKILGKKDIDALNKVIKDISTSATDIKQAAKILEEAHKGEGKISGTPDANIILGVLNGLRGNTRAWSAAVKLEKDGRSYLEKILQDLEKTAEEIKRLIKELNLDQITKKTDLDAAKGVFEGKQIDDDLVKKAFNEKIFPRKALVISLKENPSPEKTALAELIGHFWKKVDLINDSEYDKDNNSGQLTKLKEKLTGLQKYQASGSGKEKEVFEALQPNEKKVIENLISDIKSRVDDMEKAQNSSGGGSGNKPSFFSTPWGIVTIVALVCLVLAGIVYFMKNNSGEEEEEE